VTARERPRVVIVEDSDEDFDTASEAIQRAGMNIELQRFTTGDGCIEWFARQPDAGMPPLVLLDLNIPGRDGRDVLQAIRDRPALRSLPVVIVTTSANPRDVRWCFERGANAYHVKPMPYAEHRRGLEQLFFYWLRLVQLPAAEPV
jgi:CheY-like chemotaxis protein